MSRHPGLLAFLLLVVGSISLVFAKTGSIGGVVVAERPVDEDRSSLLFEITGDPSSTIDGLRLRLPKPPAENLTVGYPVTDWTVDFDGKLVELRGPLVPLPLRLRLDIESSSLPDKLQVEVLRGDVVLSRDKKVPVAEIPPAPSTDDLADLLIVPAVISPGDTVTVRVLDPFRTPPGGHWLLNGIEPTVSYPAGSFDPTSRSIVQLLSAGVGSAPPSLSPLYTFDLPSDMATGVAPWISYIDPWGFPIVEIPAIPDVELLPASPVLATDPAITDATPRAFLGEVFCVCGYMPTPTAQNGVVVGGQPTEPAAAATSRLVYVRAPAELNPGPTAVTGDPEAGFGPEDQASTELLALGGKVDQDKLRSGQETPMTLWIEGTEAPLEIEVVNETPRVISVEGGNTQVVTTSGSEPNQVVRTVKGESPGNFNITYSLTSDPCPCAGQVAAPTEPPATTVTQAPTPTEPNWVEYSVEECARNGLISPTLDGRVDLDKPIVVIVHGDAPVDPDVYDQVDFQLEQRGFQVFRWVYQDGAISDEMEPQRDEIEEFVDDVIDEGNVLDASFTFADVMKQFQEKIGFDRVTVVAHSMGGLIARDAMTIEGRGERTLADADFDVHLVTFGTPWAGTDALAGVGGFFASTFTPDFIFYGPMNEPDKPFLHGTLGDNITFSLIKTDEENTPHHVITLEGQSIPDIEDSAAEILQLRVGHSGLTYSYAANEIVRVVEDAIFEED